MKTTKPWIEHTCETCLYRVSHLCTFNPPIARGDYLAVYPIIKTKDDEYMPACAKHEKEEE